MDIESEIKTAVRQAIMKEIDGLAIRATIRERVEAAGINDVEIAKLVRQTIDSYVRSAMNGNVEAQIRQIFERIVDEIVRTEINQIIGSWSGWSGREDVRKALNEAVAREIKNGFDITVGITPKL